MGRFLAYIDAGTGSFVLQATVGVIIGVSYAVRNRVRMVIGKFKKGPSAEKSE